MARKSEAEAMEESMQAEAQDETLINEETKDGVRRKYVITRAGKEAVFEVDIATKTEYGREEQYFRVHLHRNHPKDYVVDEGNKMLIGIMGKYAKFFATLFEGSKDGKSFLGLEVKDKDGYKLQYSNRNKKGKVQDGFWFSSGERKALSLMGYLDLIEIKA